MLTKIFAIKKCFAIALLGGLAVLSAGCAAGPRYPYRGAYYRDYDRNHYRGYDRDHRRDREYDRDDRH